MFGISSLDTFDTTCEGIESFSGQKPSRALCLDPVLICRTAPSKRTDTIYSFLPINLIDHHAIQIKLLSATIRTRIFAGKYFIVIDDFFSPAELRRLESQVAHKKRSTKTHFSKNGKTESFDPVQIEELFQFPSDAFENYLLFFSNLAYRLNTKVCTQADTNWNNAIVTNYVTYADPSQQEDRFHEDFRSTDLGYAFKNPFKPKCYYPAAFVNGSENNPWLFTSLFFLADERFDSQRMGVGTLFLNKNTGEKWEIECKSGRFVIFEGDTPHALGSSKLPPDQSGIWRFSLSTLFAMLPQMGSARTLTWDYFNHYVQAKAILEGTQPLDQNAEHYFRNGSWAFMFLKDKIPYQAAVREWLDRRQHSTKDTMEKMYELLVDYFSLSDIY